MATSVLEVPAATTVLKHSLLSLVLEPLHNTHKHKSDLVQLRINILGTLGRGTQTHHCEYLLYV
jgi:hypothetical protein